MDGEVQHKVSGIRYDGIRLVFSVFAICVLFFISFLVYEIYLPHPAFTGAKRVEIMPGMGSRVIAALLKKQGVISSKWAFVAYVSLRGQASQLKPGTYHFFDTETIPQISSELIQGVNNEELIIIPEGWSTRDIAEYFRERGIGAGGDPADFFAHPPLDLIKKFSFFAGMPAGAGLEGFLFPDTYRIFHDAILRDIAEKMLENFDRKLTPDLRAEIARRKKSIFEIITMASLIEKEVASDTDRTMVSGILWKRLDAGIPLQVDATVVYAKQQATSDKGQGTRGKKQENKTKISLEDTKINSPYNTYRFGGLPPGPIANPGLSAIRAAVYPNQSAYLYYLSAPDGHSIFSKTLDEHNAAKAKYLR